MNRPHPLPMAVNLFATVLVTDYFRSLYTKVHSPFGSRKLQKILKTQHFTRRAPIWRLMSGSQAMSSLGLLIPFSDGEGDR